MEFLLFLSYDFEIVTSHFCHAIPIFITLDRETQIINDENITNFKLILYIFVILKTLKMFSISISEQQQQQNRE